MSEYIEIETELSDDGKSIVFYTNLKLGEENSESYDSVEAMEEGSAVAQALSEIDGIIQLQIDGKEMVIVRDLQVPYHAIVADVSNALKDFFL